MWERHFPERGMCKRFINPNEPEFLDHVDKGVKNTSLWTLRPPHLPTFRAPRPGSMQKIPLRTQPWHFTGSSSSLLLQGQLVFPFQVNFSLWQVGVLRQRAQQSSAMCYELFPLRVWRVLLSLPVSAGVGWKMRLFFFSPPCHGFLWKWALRIMELFRLEKTSMIEKEF